MIAVDVDRYRKRYEAELARAAASERRGQAGTRRSVADGPAGAVARADAIRTGPIDEENLAGRVAGLLATVREAALQALAALDFLGPRFEPFRADYRQALRQVATDPRRRLRENALELLAIEKDPFAQDLLRRGLERPEDALVSDARALQF